MATRIHVLDDFGAALFWGESALGCGAEDEAAGSDVPTVRSAPVPEHLHVEESGAHPCAAPATDLAEDDDVAPPSFSVELDEEPCPETLRSPVSEGVSSSVRRPRVA